MKIYNRLILLFLSFFISIIYSQTTIKGVALDGENKPIKIVNVSLHKDTILVDKIVTDSLGVFLFNVDRGNYTMKIHQFGKEIYKKTIELNRDTDLGNIVIDNTIVIKEVNIDGRKKLVEHKIDRTVYNIEDRALAVGDAMEVLMATPGLQVSEDAITIAGVTGVTGVMIDGRIVSMSGEQLINYIKSLQSNQIKNVEVITAPPAKYSVEGTSGLINIVLKKQRSNTWSAGISSSYKWATFGIFTKSANFNYKKNKISISSNLNYRVGKYRDKKYTTIEYPNQFFTSDTNIDNDVDTPSERIGIDYDITPKWSIGAIYNGYYTRPNSNSTNASKETVSLYETLGKTNKTIKNNSYNIHTTLKMDSIGGKIDLDIDYFNYFYEDNQDLDVYKNTLFDSKNKNNSHQNIDSYSINLDMDYPTKFAKLNYGTRFSFTDTKSRLYSDIKQVRFVQNDYFKYNENTQAFFASINKNFGDKFSTMFGFRLENTNFKTNSIFTGDKKKNNYIKLFPTVYLQYKLNENSNFSTNYTQRVFRANFSDINPFRIYSSPFEYWQGNPELQPIVVNRINIFHDYKGILQTYLQTEFVDKVSSGITMLENKSEIKTTPIEYASGYTFGLVETFSYDIKPWLRISIQSLVSYFKFNSKIYPQTPKVLEGIMGGFSIQSDFKINKNISTGFDLTHYSSTKMVDLSTNTPKTDLDLYFKMKLGKNWNFSLNAKNILKDKIENFSIRNNSRMNYVYDKDSMSRSVMVGINYKFGGKIKVNEKQSKNTDEASRINRQ